MKHVSIIGKFLIIMAAFGLFSLGMAFYSGRQISSIDEHYSTLVAEESTAALYLARSNRSLQGARASIGDLVMARSAELNDRAAKDINEAKASFVKYMNIAIAAMPQKAEIAHIKAEGLQIIEKACASSIAAGKSAKTEEEIYASQEAYRAQCQPAFSIISQRFTTLTNEVVDAAAAESNVLSAQSSSTVTTTLAAVIIGLITVLVVGFLAIRSWLVRPLQQMSETMNILANGDLTANVDGTDRRDEVGAMAKAVQVFKDNGLRARELEQEAASNRSASEEERLRAAELERQRAEQMARATSGLAEGLKHLSSGDLTFRLQEPFASDFESLRSDFNAAVGQLAESLRSVANATGSIDSGAREISQSAEDLSKRTEQQAASLEETAAALDQITTNVADSSKRTEEARHVAIEAMTLTEAQSGLGQSGLDHHNSHLFIGSPDDEASSIPRNTRKPALVAGATVSRTNPCRISTNRGMPRSDAGSSGHAPKRVGEQKLTARTSQR